MKRILFYICGIYNGGTEIETINLMQNLKSNYQILYYYHDKLYSDNNMVEKFNKYAKYVDINQEQVVDTLIFCTHALDDINLIKNIKYKQSYFWFHYFWKDQEEFLKIALENDYINEVITVSNYAKKKLLSFEFMKNKKNKVKIIPNIMDDKYIKEKAKEDVEFEKAKDLNLVTVARFAHIKGYNKIKKMIDILIREKIDFKWYIIGKGNNKEEHNEVLEMFKDYDKRVELLGFKENPFPYIKKSDYIVLMSKRETAGLVITEAKILGTPCIMSNIEVAYEQIKEGKNGYIIDRENISDFKEKLENIIKTKSKMKKYLSKFHYNKNKIIREWKKKI